MPLPNVQSLLKTKDSKEVVDALTKTSYGTDIAPLPTQGIDAELLEGVVLRKLQERFYFVSRVAQGKMRELLSRYCARLEVDNIKKIVRTKHGGHSFEKPILIPIPREQSLVNFEALLEAKDIDEVVSLLRDTPYSLSETLQSYKESGISLILERNLDGVYFGRVWELASKIRGVRELVGEEIDLRNILFAFLLRTRIFSQKELEEMYAIPHPYHSIMQSTLHSLVQTRLEDIPNVVTPRYSDLASEAVKLVKGDSPTPLEWLFLKRLYRDAGVTARMDPLQAGFVIAYLLMCECEAKNLVSIVTGKQLGLAEEEIASGVFTV